jgi:hypothetical protein
MWMHHSTTAALCARRTACQARKLARGADTDPALLLLLLLLCLQPA